MIGSAIGIAVLGLVLSLVSVFNAQVEETINDSNASAIIAEVQEATNVFADWMTPLALVVVMAVMITILLAIWVRFQRIGSVME